MISPGSVAKAIQSFFENWVAALKKIAGMIPGKDTTFSNAEIARLAIERNRESLKSEFPNITSISDAVNDMGQSESHVITIYLEDDNSKGIPDTLAVRMPDGTMREIRTEIVEDVGKGGIQFGYNDFIQTDTNSMAGSICCLAGTRNGKSVLVTSGHIYSDRRLINFGGWLDALHSKEVRLNGRQIIGKWVFQQITYEQDIAFIELFNEASPDELTSFGHSGFYDITDDDVKKEEVTLISGISGERNGYILDHRTMWSVHYADGEQYKSNIIIVGSKPDRNTSISLSRGGDSGGVVIHKKTGSLIGIILGGNRKYTWVLPIKETLDYFELTLL